MKIWCEWEWPLLFYFYIVELSRCPIKDRGEKTPVRSIEKTNFEQEMDIREATVDDLPAILALYAQPALDNGRCLTVNQAAAIFRTMQSYPCYKLFVAEQDERVVGTFALMIMENLGHQGAPSGLVEDVAVDPSCQRQGIGRAMLDFAMARCRDAGCYKMALSANRIRTRAHAFYESLGFVRHGYSFVVEPEELITEEK